MDPNLAGLGGVDPQMRAQQRTSVMRLAHPDRAELAIDALTTTPLFIYNARYGAAPHDARGVWHDHSSWRVDGYRVHAEFLSLSANPQNR
ncbi:hypothetical protein EVAR_70898_1 [Eumeta japonica]|uniref:Uncharacterized protein n=1 Tax=Eumeta variegata TaxID=151549 RepID=A0A4C2AE83_EUMVA|nr:hypothetical protein EVAR_70898_1 [Eumeta japonica]